MLKLDNSYIRNDGQLMLEYKPHQFISYRAAFALGYKMTKSVHDAALDTVLINI